MRDIHRLFPIIICSALALEAPAQTQRIGVAQYFGGRQAAVSYTFDDGLQEQYTVLFPELRRRGLKATFAVIGSKVGKNMKGTPCMTWEQLREMAADGQEISSHGWGHQSVLRLTGESLRSEVQRNDTAIYNNVGVFPRTYFYPGNRKTDEALRFCSRDRVGTRTSQISIGSKRDTIWLKHWIADLMESGEWGVGMTHGICHGYDAFPNPQTLWSHLDYVCTLRDRLWIATFHDVAAYTREREAVSLDIKNHGSRIEITPTMPLDSALFRHPLTLTLPLTAGEMRAEQDGKRLTITRRKDCVTLDFNPHGGTIIVETSPKDGERLSASAE